MSAVTVSLGVAGGSPVSSVCYRMICPDPADECRARRTDHGGAACRVREAGALLPGALPCLPMVGRRRRQSRPGGTTRPARAPRGPLRRPCVPAWTEAAVCLSLLSTQTSMSIGRQPTGTMT